MADLGVDQRAPSGDNTHHFWRIFAIWAVLSAIVDPIFYLVAGPHMPPGRMTDSASGNQWDFNILMTIAIPVILGVVIYLLYSIVVWRGSKAPEPVGGPQARGNLKIQIGWIATTTVIVMGLFVFGTVELIVPAGAGGGEGPNPVWTPTSKNILPVQVIAQQWKFTYRYPTFGGFETDQLMLPNNTEIAFHVTSLDVIHDFWAYQLSIKADANPTQDNVAFTKTSQLGRFTVRCDELCGIWHGAMFNYGRVVSKTAFAQWATSTEKALAPATKLLPPFSWYYVPDANGADGGYYPNNVVPYSKVEQYGAVTAHVG